MITMHARNRRLSSAAVAVAVAAATASLTLSGQGAPAQTASIDAIFAKWTASTPGCAVGVAANGRPVLSRGYGMADLEHDVRISPDTIFEAGSVSKQFTVAAVMLLAREGKLSLDDQVRKYVPELPEYGASLTIRHMLNHTSGLRDWGSVAGIGGWPRTTRVYTQAHMLDIVSRQRALNFTPGTRWSYSNTGFNLAALIVGRVSGTPFPEFTRQRLFEPLGMAHTSWRDDYTRIVKGRAMAYTEESGVLHTLMPFEDVYGNGGLLTTVGDLLTWNEHYDSPPAGDAAMVAEQQQPGHFNDGRPHGYGLGLFVGTYKGLHEVYHSGSTAGYSAFLTRFPGPHVSVAVLCNATTAQATQYAHAVADMYLAGRLKPPTPPAPLYEATPAQLDSDAGLYRDMLTDAPVSLVREKEGLRIEHGPALVPVAAGRFVTADGRTAQFDGQGGMRVTDEFGTVNTFARTPRAGATQPLDGFVGTYESAEAETTMTALVEKGGLVLKRRPDTSIALTPLYADAFAAPRLGTVIFRRDAAARVVGFSVSQDRVWDLRFTRMP